MGIKENYHEYHLDFGNKLKRMAWMEYDGIRVYNTAFDATSFTGELTIATFSKDNSVSYSKSNEVTPEGGKG